MQKHKRTTYMPKTRHLRDKSRKNQKVLTYVLITVVALLAVIAIEFAILLGGNSGYGGMFAGMMGGSGWGLMSQYSDMIAMMNGGMMGGANNFSAHISISTAEAYANALPSYAHAYSNNNTLSFSSSNITLVVLAMGVQRAINLTHEQPPSFDSNSSGNAFVIDGLINPTLMIPKGAIVHVEFINLDSGEYHNVIITATGPQYQYMPMSAMGGIVSMMPIIPHANYSGGSASEYNYTTVFDNPGTYWYLCMYPGHAQMGMYGKIIVA
jgi:rusticyanin